MRPLPLFLLLFLFLLLPSCLPDGKVDVEEVKRQIREVRADGKFPSREEFRARAEREIVQLPLDEQPEARRQLERALRVYPTESQLDSIIRVVADRMPGEAEMNDIVEEVVRELPSKSEMKRAADQLIDNLPENAEIEDILKTGISTLQSLMDSLSRAPR